MPAGSALKQADVEGADVVFYVFSAPRARMRIVSWSRGLLSDGGRKAELAFLDAASVKIWRSF